MDKRKFVPVTVAAAELGVTVKHIYTLLNERRLLAIDISASGNGGPQSLRVSMESLRVFRNSRKFDPDKLCG